jgi:hypothetical protein
MMTSVAGDYDYDYEGPEGRGQAEAGGRGGGATEWVVLPCCATIAIGEGLVEAPGRDDRSRAFETSDKTTTCQQLLTSHLVAACRT